MKNCCEDIFAPGLRTAAAAAAGLLLALYPAQSAYILVKAAAALSLFYFLFRLLGWPGLRRSGAGTVPGLVLALLGLGLGLLFFLHPRLFWVLGLSAAAVLLILYGLLRIPMIWEIWSAGAAARLSGILWALLPLAAGALLLFFPAQAALILIRLCGLLMCILGLWHAVSSLLSGSGLR